MKTINLRDFYPWYTSDEFVEVSDEVAAVMRDAERQERNYVERVRYNKAYYSLDAGDGIEAEACYINLSPHEIYERQFMRCRLCCALNSLSKTQGTRVDAHFILGISKSDIARAEGTDESSVRESIERGLRNMKNYLKSYI